MSAVPTSTDDPVADLRNAADLIREQHRNPADPLSRFWQVVASSYGRMAQLADAGLVNNGTMGQRVAWNETVSGARCYLDANGGQPR